MNSFRQSRFVAALIALFSMLFMQLAVASYACPGLKMGQDSKAVAMVADTANQNMSGCTGMDMEQPGLCHAHDHAGNQSLDKPELPQVQPFMAVGLTLTLIPIEIAYRPLVSHPEDLLLTRATAPPLSIRNCCFRI